jgi:tetratricopeptide (TPR) repeat protein
VPPGPKGRAARATLARALALTLAGAGAYLPALGGGFVFDDPLLIERSRFLRGPLSAIWFGATASDYWPVTWTALWVQWRLFGTSPAGYHAVNLALHLGAAILLWRVLSALRVPGAWVAGLLFALHPAGVETAAWISEQKNTLSAVLFLLTLGAWVRFDEERTPRLRWTAVALFALALLAKVSVAFLPAVLLGLAWARRRRIGRRDLADVLPFALLAIAAAAVNVWFQHENAMGGGWAPARTLAERLGGTAWAYLRYVQTAYLPVRLAILYPPWPVGPESRWWWVPAAAVLVLFAALWRFRSGPARPALLALGYQLAAVVPVIGLVDIAFLRLAPVSNHLQYLALMGPCALAGAAASRLHARAPRPGLAAAAAVAAALAALTFGRARAYQDEATFWAAAAREAPGSAVAREQHAAVLADAGRTAEALAELEAAAEVARDPARREELRAGILFSSGRPAEAADAARRVLALTGSPELRSDAGWFLLRTGHPAEAVEVFTDLSRRAPNGSEYTYRLAAALSAEGRGAEAYELLRAWTAARPGHPRMEAALVLLLSRQGRMDLAHARAAQVLGVSPGDPRAEALLAEWLRTAGIAPR